MIRAIAAALVLTVAPLASRDCLSAQKLPTAKPSEHALTLRYKLARGDRFAYQVEVDIEAGTQEAPDLAVMRGEGVRAFVVTSVGSDGRARVSMRAEDIRDAGTVENSKIHSRRSATFVLDRLGGVSSVKRGNQAVLYSQAAFIDPSAFSIPLVALPRRPVKPGDTWSNAVPNPLRGAGKGTETLRFEGWEVFKRNVRTARLSHKVTVPVRLETPARTEDNKEKRILATGTIELNGITNFAVERGRVIHTRLAGTGILRVIESDRGAADLRVRIAVSINIS